MMFSLLSFLSAIQVAQAVSAFSLASAWRPELGGICSAALGFFGPSLPLAADWLPGGVFFLLGSAAVAFFWIQQAGRVPATAETPVSEAADPEGLITVARLISIIGHPFTFIVLLLLEPFFTRGDPAALRAAGVVAAAGLVPLGLFMRNRYRTGHWQSVDASAPRDRPIAYVAVFTVLVPVLVYFLCVERSPELVRGGIVVGLMLAVGATLNRWIKGSGHMAFAAFSAVVLAKTGLLPAFAVIAFLPALAWSRIKLQRHTVSEVIGGCILGGLSGGLLLLLSGA